VVILAGSAITLVVISSNLDLVGLCRDVLRELAEARGDIRLPARGDRDAHSEICLWDYDSVETTPMPEEFRGNPTLYLVHPTQLDALLRTEPGAEGHILLKPLTRPVLRSFLWSVDPSEESSVSSVVGTLRANRDDLLQRLLQANLRLQEYDQQRTNFIARAVHDFRAPLTALAGYCGLLASGQLGPLNDDQGEALRRMEHSSKRLTRMASAMFELSVGPKIMRQPDLREGDILERIKQALHEIRPLVREKQISLKAEDIVPPGRPLYFEASEIEQVLINLLDNACKFSHSDGAIEIRGYPYFWERRFLVRGSAPRERRLDDVRVPNAYRIDIKDTGPGIPADRLHHIFEEYTSYAGPQDRSGGGLGLAICRLIMARHEGHIWADSHKNGAIFSFVLPYPRADSGNNPERHLRIDK